jgi:hypothetical protein
VKNLLIFCCAPVFWTSRWSRIFESRLLSFIASKPALLSHCVSESAASDPSSCVCAVLT